MRYLNLMGLHVNPPQIYLDQQDATQSSLADMVMSYGKSAGRLPELIIETKTYVHTTASAMQATESQTLASAGQSAFTSSQRNIEIDHCTKMHSNVLLGTQCVSQHRFPAKTEHLQSSFTMKCPSAFPTPSLSTHQHCKYTTLLRPKDGCNPTWGLHLNPRPLGMKSTAYHAKHTTMHTALIDHHACKQHKTMINAQITVPAAVCET